jgi:multidrug efflux system outer membrane protein
MRKTWLSMTTVALLAGCAVGPDFTRPEPPVAPAFAHAETAAAAVDEAEFWRGFADPLLARLVDEALAGNHDLAAALARYDRANALLRGARLDRFPTVRAQAQGSDARLTAAEAVDGARDVEHYEAGIVASWELDLFGRVRRQVEAGAAQVSASAADVQALRVALAGEVARTYVSLRGRQERLRVALGNADNQQETLRLVQTRLDAGIGTEFDTARTRAQLETTRSRIPALEAEIAVDMHRLAVLTGREPDALLETLKRETALPELPARIDAGTPGDLLRRRPDVAAAEHRLHAATAHIGVATADLFPRFTLAGLLGSAAPGASELFDGGTGSHSMALGIDWSFLDSGRVRAGIAAAQADADGALARYRQAVLLALEDVENALVRYGRARAEDAHLAQAAADSEHASKLARIRFEAGAIGLLDVLDAERTRLQSQDQLAEARTRTVAAAVNLYVALAGGWSAA